MNDYELIISLAKMLVEREKTIKYLREENDRMRTESVKISPLSYPETVHALAHAEVPKCQTVTD